MHHTTVITWVKHLGQQLPDAPEPEQIPEVGELDELETYVGSKNQALAADGSRPFPRRHHGLGGGRPQQ